MQIILNNISKRFASRWIFKNLSFEFNEAGRYALTGRNGAGKSTLINIIVGKSPQTKGEILYFKNNKPLSIDLIFREISIASTAMSVIEEFTLEELVNFHFKFRPLVDKVEKEMVYSLIGLDNERKKTIANFSSGMKQRLKIGLAILSKSSILILDEPGANLDEVSKEWFQSMLSRFLEGRILIIASNDPEDYRSCNEYLEISNPKD